MKFALRGDGRDAGRAVEAAGGEIVDAADATDAAAAIVVGEDALRSLADDPAPAPVLPVEAGVGRHGVSRSRLGAAVGALRRGDYRTVPHPVFAVEVGGQRVGRAVLDASLMTSEPAHISEYAVRAGGERVDRFRSDGVVVATPAGSEGYARAAGGPRIVAGTGAAVVPVSPYATDSDAWVLPTDVVVTVERDDTAVSLFLDGREARGVDADRPVRISRDRDLPILRPTLDGE